jgi:N-acetylglutamate synthase-like GNAT family acetyltransferase
MDRICFPDDIADVSSYTKWWVAEDNGKLVAYSGLKLVGNEDVGYFCRVGVLPSYRGRGLQRRMMRAKIRYARKLKLKRIVSYTTPLATVSGNNLIECGFRLYRPDWLWGDTDWLYFKFDL